MADHAGPQSQILPVLADFRLSLRSGCGLSA